MQAISATTQQQPISAPTIITTHQAQHQPSTQSIPAHQFVQVAGTAHMDRIANPELKTKPHYVCSPPMTDKFQIFSFFQNLIPVLHTCVQAWYFILEGARQFFLGKGHLYEEFVNFYWDF